MQQVAPGVWLIDGFLDHFVNAYLVGDVLIDALTRWHTWHLSRKLLGHRLSAVALTHCHPDHQGAAWFLCRKFKIPLACHEADIPAMEGTGPMLPQTFIVNRLGRFISGQPYAVSRRLKDGDEIAGFRVIHTPGHTPGHVMLFREFDRVAIAGDLLANMSFITLEPGLRLPPPFFCTDPRQNRRSVELLASLDPSLVLFGHGPPLHKVEQLHSFVERMQRRQMKV